MSFASPDDDDDEQWLQEPKIDSPVKDWRGQPRKPPRRDRPRPIQVGKIKKTCQHCGEKAAIELFRDGKCLACQTADFLGPL